MRNSSGFTLIELVTVMIILGIISAVAIPRFFTRNQFDAYGFGQNVRAALRFAQKSAIAKRRTVCVVSAGNTLTLTFSTAFNGACNTALINPADGDPYVLAPKAGSNTMLGAANFNFDALGQPVDAAGNLLAASQSIAIGGGDVPDSVIVNAVTGYVQ